MSSDDLDQIIPQPATHEVAGVTLEIRPLTVGKIAAMMRHLRPVLDAWNQLATPNGGVPYLGLMERAGPDAVAAVALATCQPVSWVESLSMIDHINIAGLIIEANPNFFVQVLRENPELGRILEAATVGQTPSPDSLTPDTATTAS